jgi:signal recognition particle subunit SRP54
MMSKLFGGGGGGAMPDIPPELANDPKALQKALSSGGLGGGLPKGMGGGLPGLPGSSPGLGGGLPPGLPGLPSGKKKKK